MTLPLFAECALPGCAYPADEPGAPCPSCRGLFDGSAGGWSIQQAGQGVPETADEVTQRKVEQRVAQAKLQAPKRKQNQTCWLCEERRTCTRAASGWECDTCQTIT